MHKASHFYHANLQSSWHFSLQRHDVICHTYSQNIWYLLFAHYTALRTLQAIFFDTPNHLNWLSYLLLMKGWKPEAATYLGTTCLPIENESGSKIHHVKKRSTNKMLLLRALHWTEFVHTWQKLFISYLRLMLSLLQLHIGWDKRQSYSVFIIAHSIDQFVNIWHNYQCGADFWRKM